MRWNCSRNSKLSGKVYFHLITMLEVSRVSSQTSTYLVLAQPQLFPQHPLSGLYSSQSHRNVKWCDLICDRLYSGISTESVMLLGDKSDQPRGYAILYVVRRALWALGISATRALSETFDHLHNKQIISKFKTRINPSYGQCLNSVSYLTLRTNYHGTTGTIRSIPRHAPNPYILPLHICQFTYIFDSTVCKIHFPVARFRTSPSIWAKFIL